MRRQISQTEFEEDCLSGWPKELSLWAREAAEEKALKTSRIEGNLWLGETSDALNDTLRRIPFDLIESEHAIREKAARLAKRCARSTNLDWMRKTAVGYGVSPPDPTVYSRAGQRRRLECPRWWRRKIRHHFGRVAEDALRSAGMVRSGLTPYISKFSLRRRKQQKYLFLRAVESTTLVSDNGDEIGLSDAIGSSIANPKNRRTELMVRIKGLEQLSKHRSDVAVFYTLTAPSAFHAQREKGGQNPRHGGQSAKDAMQWLTRQWARARTALHRKQILIYGFRVTEPHHDGTPHFHLLLFMPREHSETVLSTLRHYWLQEFGEEPGANLRRVVAKEIDCNKGSAIGYVAKYIAKNIDAVGVEDDHEVQLPATETAELVDAWAATNGLRQFQQIGGPPITIWRELRRLRQSIPHRSIEVVRAAANASDYAAFVNALGGIESGRQIPIKLWKERSRQVTRYDEPRGPVVIGVKLETVFCRTREQVWRVRWGAVDTQNHSPSKNTAIGPLASSRPTNRSQVQSYRAPKLPFGFAPPWTRSNNCTEKILDQTQQEHASFQRLPPRPCRISILRQPLDPRIWLIT